MNSDFECILMYYDNVETKYNEMLEFLYQNQDFNPNGSSELYSEMWAISSIIDSLYTGILYRPEEFNRLVELQDTILLHLINYNKAKINYKSFYRMISERNNYVIRRGGTIKYNLMDLLNENKRERSPSPSPSPSFKRKKYFP